MLLGPPSETELQMNLLDGSRPITVTSADGNPAHQGLPEPCEAGAHIPCARSRERQCCCWIRARQGPAAPRGTASLDPCPNPRLPSPNPTFTAAPSASPRPALLRSSCPARFACGMAANSGHQCQCHGPEVVAKGLGTHRGERRSGAEERPRPEGLRAVKRAVCTGDTGGRPWLLPETAGADPRPTPHFGGAAALAGGRAGPGRAEQGHAGRAPVPRSGARPP